jgi:hypothetical protein
MGGWNRAGVAKAIAALLADLDESVTVFDAPPSTLNPPAYVVRYPSVVDYDVPTFGVDLGTLPVEAIVAPGEFDRLDAMLDDARQALSDDDNLGGAVVTQSPRSQSGWRMFNVAGVDVMAAQLILEIRM